MGVVKHLCFVLRCEAVKHVLGNRFSAVVFSFQFNDMNNAQIFSVIRAIDYDLPVIIVADNNEPLSSMSSIIHESFRLFRKPVDCREIEKAVCEAVQVKKDN